MSSAVQAQADAVRSAVTSVQSCTPSICASLKELLHLAGDEHEPDGDKDDGKDDGGSAAATATATAAATASKPTGRRPTATTTTTQGAGRVKARADSGGRAAQQKQRKPAPPHGGGLSAREKAVLATQVINATLRALGEAAKKSSAAAAAAAPSHAADPKLGRKTALRRSSSATGVAMTPLQARALNRVPASPAAASRKGGQHGRSASVGKSASAGSLATIECARAAFATLRALSKSGKVQLPELQLETGMSTFANKLMGLGLHEQALKELRLLKRRLEAAAPATGGRKKTKTGTMSGTATTTSSNIIHDLFDFPLDLSAAGPVLGLMVTVQLQALRLLHLQKRSSQMDKVLRFLQPSSPSSPLALLLRSAEGGKAADGPKCARQLESLAQSLLSLTPSLSREQDGVAVEPRISPTPETALQCQALGLSSRLHAWMISGQRGDVDKDVLLPLSRCLSAFNRRSASASMSKYQSVTGAFSQVWQAMEDDDLKASLSCKSTLASIFQLLGTASRECGHIKEAKEWLSKLSALTNAKDDSAARCCSVAAQLLALSLRQSVPVEEKLVADVMDGLQGPLSGNTGELNDLLASLCLVRKAAVHRLLGDQQARLESGPVRAQLESLLLQLPRFASRWLGKVPAAGSASKDFLLFEERRQHLSKYIHHILDSALMLVKQLLDEQRVDWQLLDSVLQHILLVLDNVGEVSSQRGGPAAASSSYHVKISHLYYQQHLGLRKGANDGTDNNNNNNKLVLRALHRSIDSIKQRPSSEQSKGQMIAKQERLVELCTASGRRDDAAAVLRDIRDALVRDDTVLDITTALSTQPLSKAWQSSQQAATLSRTVCNLAKLDHTPTDWTWLLTGPDKATALEHDLFYLRNRDDMNGRQTERSEAMVNSLLACYSVDEYPLRRLRTLVQLLIISQSSSETMPDWADEAQELSDKLDVSKLGLDVGLARYIPHQKALTACVLALFNRDLSSPQISQALATWGTMISRSQSEDDLIQQVDEPCRLLNLVRSLADFARMKGSDGLLRSLLELSTSICQLSADRDPERAVSQSTALCLQYLTMGYTCRAEQVLGSNQALLSRIRPEAVTSFHLSSTEYHLAVGKVDQAERHLTDAQASARLMMSEKACQSSKCRRQMLMAHASYLHSTLATERGEWHHALRHAKNAVRLLYHDWAKMETLRTASHHDSVTESEEGDSSFNSSTASSTLYEVGRAKTGPEFWALIRPLFRFVLRLSWVYAHIGMYQETLYYAEQAHKISVSIDSPAYTSQSSAWLAAISLSAGGIEKAIALATEAKGALATLEPSRCTVDLACRLGRIFRDTGDHGSESALVDLADAMLHSISQSQTVPILDGGLEVKTGKPGHQGKTRAAVKPTARTCKATKAPTTQKKPAPHTAKSPPQVEVPSPAPKDSQLASVKASILHLRTAALLDKKEWVAAAAYLQASSGLCKLSTDVMQDRLLLALAFIGQSVEQMGRDSVYSIIQDSTLSFPSVAGWREKTVSGRNSLLSAKTSPPKKGRGVGPKQSFLDSLGQAQDCLLEAHAIAAQNGNGKVVHTISALLQSAAVLLSTASPTRAAGAVQAAHATCSVELARNLLWRRQGKALLHDHDQADKTGKTGKTVKTDKTDMHKAGKTQWPTTDARPDSRRSSLAFSIDMSGFQRDYVDMLPATWNVMSVSLSDNQHDLCITKLQAGHSPFAIRLPLERASSRDGSTDLFSFQQARSQLRDIIAAANRTCHDARDMTAKGAKTAWWAERADLDDQLKLLLDKVELIWLGGFRGIFGQQARRPELLARFQRSFQNILDKHLPSRRQRGGRGRRAKTSANKVALDPRILDLFVGLDGAASAAADLDDCLLDLLYFVVDILQFHGERNAYDEIDFDLMIVETQDALHAYHAAAAETSTSPSPSPATGAEAHHTILVLDKSLHCFPWESLPCMLGLAVSRMPSLACLRRAIIEQRPCASVVSSRQPGHHVALSSGTYMLNPSADLKNTQATFGKPLARQLAGTWRAVEARAPTEHEFERALLETDVLLYFGHGSGAQYIRGRTVRGLSKCRAVALLMGCASAELHERGPDFDLDGTVWNYMLAGCPAVVGTLWDVTDRDIDRFAARMLGDWGLLLPPGGTFPPSPAGCCSLVQAVTNAREAGVCRFRYLTAAAVCVYGIPVYVDR